jgi:hypothetical protein
MKQTNALSGAERHRLNMFIEGNREIATKHTDSAIADIATESLGFKVSSGNVAGSRKAVGLAKNRPKGALKNNAVNFVAKELLQLLLELGKEPSQILRQIAERRRMEVTE